MFDLSGKEIIKPGAIVEVDCGGGQIKGTITEHIHLHCGQKLPCMKRDDKGAGAADNGDFILFPHYKVTIVSATKCECGGEKSNTTHSDWCPKYVNR